MYEFKTKSESPQSKALAFKDKLRPYVCDVCDRRFSVKSSLDTHQKSKHTDPKLRRNNCYNCPVKGCEYVFRTKVCCTIHQVKEHPSKGPLSSPVSSPSQSPWGWRSERYTTALPASPPPTKDRVQKPRKKPQQKVRSLSKRAVSLGDQIPHLPPQ